MKHRSRFLLGAALAALLCMGAATTAFAHHGNHSYRAQTSACTSCDEGRVQCTGCTGTGRTADGAICSLCGQTGYQSCGTCHGTGNASGSTARRGAGHCYNSASHC